MGSAELGAACSRTALWAGLVNGDLIDAAEQAGFDLLVTTDKGIRHRQNWSGRRLSLLVLSTNDWTRIRRWTALVVSAVDSIGPSSYLEIEIPFD